MLISAIYAMGIVKGVHNCANWQKPKILFLEIRQSKEVARSTLAAETLALTDRIDPLFFKVTGCP